MAWDVPVHRIQAYVQSLNRQRTARRDKRRAEFHLKRARAQLMPARGLRSAKDAIWANVILNDIRPRGLQVFCSQSLPVGQDLAITIPTQREFYARGKVIGSEPLNMRIATDNGLTTQYRVTILFEFQSIDERLAIRNYCDELQKSLYDPPKGAGHV